MNCCTYHRTGGLKNRSCGGDVGRVCVWAPNRVAAAALNRFLDLFATMSDDEQREFCKCYGVLRRVRTRHSTGRRTSCET